MSYIQDVLEEIKTEDGQNVSKDHLFREWLNYEGIIGYDYKIKSVIKEIYGVEVED